MDDELAEDLREVRERLLRSLSSAALAASGLSEKRVGTGPAMASPSNISHSRFHSARSTAGTLSLGK